MKYYLNEIVAGISDKKFDMDKHSTSKFLFYHFNNLRPHLGEEAYKTRHTIVSEDQHALETLQSKDWPYFIKCFLKVSEGDITSFNLSGISQSENDIKELKIINDTIENLEIFKNYYADIYENVGGSFQNYSKKKMEDDIRLNLYSSIDLKDESNTKEIMHTFDRFFFAFGRFPAINELAIIPTGDALNFVRSSDIILPSELYEKFSLGNARGLVFVHFLATLNVHLGGDKMSVQALSKSDDAILIKFDAINKLNKS